jgi:hypothetical protein
MINQFSTKSKSRQEDFDTQENKIIVDNQFIFSSSIKTITKGIQKGNNYNINKEFNTQNTNQETSPIKKPKRLIFKDMIKEENNKHMSLCEVVEISYNEDRKDFLKLKSLSSKSSKSNQKQNKTSAIKDFNENNENCSCLCLIF